MKLLSHYLAICLISLLPFISLFVTPQMPHTHDGPVHLARMAAYYKALTDGQILPRWAADLNYGYGMPLFNFIYHLPYLAGSLFLAMGAGLVTSFKLVLMVSFLLSGIFMLGFCRRVFKNPSHALFVTLFYQFAPFRLVELLVRGSIGEAYTYTFLPAALWGLTMLVERPTWVFFVLTSIATTLLILSHNSISLVFFLVSILFLKALVFPRWKTSLPGVGALLLGVSLATFYWLPAIIERRYTYGDLFMKSIYLSHFPKLFQFFVPNFTNLTSLQTGGVAVQFGPFHTIGLVLGAYLLVKKKKFSQLPRRILVFSIGLTLAALFFMQPLSTSLWANLPLLRQFQFPWRFLSVVAVTSSLASVSYWFVFRTKQLLWTIAALAIGATLVYWRPPLGFDRVDEEYFWDYPLNTTFFGETDLIWSAGPASGYPQQRVEVIEGDATISQLFKGTTLHTFDVEAKGPARFVDRTQYFPGWRVYVDGVKVPIQFQDPNWRGLITVSLPEGRHSVRVMYQKSKTQWISEAISLTSLLTLIGIGLTRRRLPHL